MPHRINALLSGVSRTALGAAFALTLLAAPSSAGEPKAFNIPVQEATTAIRVFGQQAGIQVLATVDDLRGKRVNAVVGKLDVQDALRQMLVGTGLTFRATDSNTILIQKPRATAYAAPETSGQAPASSQPTDPEDQRKEEIARDVHKVERGKPEIVTVVGQRKKSLNADIERTEDDIQPRIVIDRDEIERSGARDLEELLRQRVPTQTNPATASQSDSFTGNSSSINLRGLGPNQTLILIDGRRVASRSQLGSAGQPDINGIPLAAIERIEILPNTASGIYGGSATGGVINIVLRRDYVGAQVLATYGDLFDSAAASRRFDLGGGFNVNGGLTNILLAASYAASDDLLVTDRNLLDRGRNHILGTNPAFFFNAASPPLGYTTNIRSTTGTNLTLKPAFGGGALSSFRTSVPIGYAGPASDNGAALIANAGTYNLDLADTAQPSGGGRRNLVSNPIVMSASATIRHEFSSWLKGFFDFSASRNDGRFVVTPANSSTFTLAASASSNPFNQAIRVTVPLIGAERQLESRNDNLRAVVGATFDLPAQWRGAADYTWNRTSFSATNSSGALSALAATDVANGVVNVFRDVNAFPTSFSTYVPGLVKYGPGETQMDATALRLSGPLWFSLPGGDPIVSLVTEYREEALDAFSSDFVTSAQVNFARSQSIASLYGEVYSPIIGEENNIPGIDLLELQLAARFDDYDIIGSNRSLTALPAPEQRTQRKFTSTNPTVGLRWKPFSDLMVRASYGTGFLPPSMDQLSPDVPQNVPGAFTTVRDPLRGNEPLGDFVLLQGGNPSLRPESSESWAAGLVVTPSFISGLRVSLDWTRIEKTDNVAFVITAFDQAGFNNALQFAPERYIRDPNPATWGAFGIGPIIVIDASAINVARAEFEFLDLTVDQLFVTKDFGEFTLSARATRNLQSATQLTPLATAIENVGTRSALLWRANATLTWDYGDFNASWSTNYFDDHYVSTNRAVNLNQGSSRIDAQIYHDAFLKYQLGTSGDPEFLKGAEVLFGVRNVFDQEPPVDVSTNQFGFYSSLGDPRGATYYISLRKSF